MKYFDRLPRCVYQGDLNLSNVLIDNNKHFVGIIDFNMYGTEVNINCFLNESMYYLCENDFIQLEAKQIYDKMNLVQNRLLNSILMHYTLNDIEKEVINSYKAIISLCFYPNVMLWIELIQAHKYEAKVIKLINLICKIEI